ncbi:MAG TPA: Fic family protein [Rectinema sp.]|nr:Fic family protein [Myxococcales bacterium]OQA59485.1 MAG: Adenosine monophosphate-protein transferase SoFic [bacterium ADurb.Bin270]HPW45100.1 Fic family protein [bacterium]HQB07541.1 Fic family protein [Rectinema sp.]
MSKQSSGHFIRCKEGYQAFIPNQLPPEITWSTKLTKALSDADRLIGKLAGEGKRLPNPHLLMRPFLRREAVLSSRIEGTQSTLGELLAKEAGANVERSPDDLREVGNYVTAIEYGIKRLKTLPLSLRLVRELHEKLMKGVRGRTATPGEFRRSQNWIGIPGSTISNATYIPPPPNKLMSCLGDWEKFLHDRTIPPLVQVAMIHYQFEAIHPFLDGNGRVGRLLITLLLIERDILPTPLLYLSAFFEATRRDYYDLLLDVSLKGNWEKWLEYFFNGVARQSEDALSRAERINKKLDTWKDQITAKTLLKVIDMIAANPFVTVKGVAAKLKVAFTTAQRAVDKLKDLGILKQMDKAKRDRVYCAKDIFDILEEPAKLDSSS